MHSTSSAEGKKPHPEQTWFISNSTSSLQCSLKHGPTAEAGGAMLRSRERLSVLPVPGKGGTASVVQPRAEPPAASPSPHECGSCQKGPLGCSVPPGQCWHLHCWPAQKQRAATEFHLKFLVLLTISTTPARRSAKGLCCKVYDFNQTTPLPCTRRIPHLTCKT